MLFIRSLLVIYFMYVCVHAQSLSHVQLFATPWTVACQAPQSMEFSRQGYWSGLPFPSPGDLPDQGTEPRVSLFTIWTTSTYITSQKVPNNSDCFPCPTPYYTSFCLWPTPSWTVGRNCSAHFHTRRSSTGEVEEQQALGIDYASGS